MLWGFQQLATKIPFLTNYPRVIGIQQEFLNWGSGQERSGTTQIS
ncbi:hypothetical protein [Microcoleus sp. herbarium14]